MTEEAEALMGEVKRQTNEINECRERVASLGIQRRHLFAALRAEGVTYSQLAEVTGLHHMTIQQDMARYRDENPKEMWEAFTKATAKSATTGEPCDTDLHDSNGDAVAVSV
jgi:DNA-directed RNA polymerase specialized sigma24 family protein